MICQFQIRLYTQKIWKKGLKKITYFYTHSHNSIIHTGQQMEAIQVSMDRQFHKQTVVYTQWNMIWSLKVVSSDNATTWTNLIVITLSETNQTKKGQIFCDSSNMRYENKSNSKPEKPESDCQGLKRVDVSWTQFHLGKLTSHDFSKISYTINWKPYAIKWI